MADIKALFAADGALAQAVRDYQPRPGQQELAEAVADNVSDDGILLAEAGTGTGKTFAYLLPLLASGKKGLVSTATRNLQEQIFTKDLPLVRKVLRSTARVALLKGRRNYLCHHHYHQYFDSEPHTAEEKAWRRAIERFFDKTADGDLVALSEIPEDAPVLARITSTAENCLGRDCAFFEECFVQQARQKAKEADVTIINHHLLLADFALKSEGFAEILPDIQAFVIDEAHHLPLTAIHFLGDRLSARQLLGFISDGEAAALAEAPDALELRETLRDLKLQHSKILLAVRQPTETRLDEEQLFAHRAFWTELQALAALFELLHIQLAPQKARGKLLAHLDGRCQDLQKLLAAFLAEDRAALHAAERALRDTDYHLLVQGRAGKNILLADFRRHERAVLLATSSFWEGVDVRGDRLVCVVIDKLPFAAPNDPVTRARHRLLEDKGLSPFMHDTLPQAIITLKQGVGRLIRDSGDYGVLVLADPRLTQKNYGQTFLNSLPPMSKTRKIEVIDRFFAYHETTKTA